MALRDFIDSRGTRWSAWDIPPARAYQPGRGDGDRRVSMSAGYQPERRSGMERRRREMPPQLLHGWVCFESEMEKRRLIPPPRGWENVSDEELESLCREAKPQPRVRV